MSSRDSFLADSLHLVVLVSFAIAQPLFDLLSRNVGFFVARRSQPLDIILFVLIVCYVPPLVFILIEGITAVLGRTVRKSIHGLIVASLAASVILPILRPIAGVPGSVLIAGAALFGVITALGTLRFYPVRLFLTVLSPVVVIFPGLFLFYSPVSRAVFVHPAAEVPEAAFRAGRNAVEFFVVSLEGARPRLQFAQSAGGGTYTLVSAKGQSEERIVAADGASIRLVTHSLVGYLDAVVVSGDFVEARGWAVDVKNLELPKAILVFANGELRYAGHTGSVARPEIAAHFGKAALQEAGFSYTFPLQLSDGGNNLEVRVFAVSKGGVAAELIYPAGYRWRKKPLPLELAEPLKQMRFLEHGIRIPVVETNEPRIGADTSEDLGRVVGEMADRWRKKSSSLRIPVVETHEPRIGADASEDLGRVQGRGRW